MSPQSQLNYSLPLPLPQPRYSTPYAPQVDQTDLLERLASLLSAQNRRGHLPTIEPDIFSGDPLHFPSWIKAFDSLVEDASLTDKDKLFYLSKYTAGEAKRSISGFLTLDGPDVYQRAKYVIKNRFGDRFNVAAAFKRKLENWPIIKSNDGKAMREYADFLEQCNSAMESTKYLDCLNSYDENQKMLRKMPRYIVDRWNRIIDKWLYGTEQEKREHGEHFEGSFPPFSTFCRFVSDEARIACGPGLIGMETKSQTKFNDTQRGKISSFTTASQAKEKTPYCNICAGEHPGAECKIFLGMNVDDRRAIALKKGVCFKCLRKGHLVKECKRTQPSLLFGNLPQEEKSIPSEERPSATSLRVDINTELEHHSPIVPVKIYHKDNPEKIIKAYAVLDNQSNGCFVSNSLANQLCTERQQVKFKTDNYVKGRHS